VKSQTNSSDFFVNSFVFAAAREVGRGRFRGKGGHLLLPPHPLTALPGQWCEHPLVNKKVPRFCLAHHLWTSLYIIRINDETEVRAKVTLFYHVSHAFAITLLGLAKTCRTPDALVLYILGMNGSIS